MESSTIAKIDTSSKKFQAQVHRLKILKGVGEQNPQPCSKQNGFLSLEMAHQMTYVSFRSLTGQTLFKGIVSAKAKVKVLTEADKPKYAD